MVTREKVLKAAGMLHLGFSIDSQNKVSVDQVIKFFNNPNGKGLLLSGNKGTGKTTLLKCISELFRGKDNYFRVIESRHIVREFVADGVEVCSKYGKDSFHLHKSMTTGEIVYNRNKPKHICIDDLGLEETNQGLYGNKSNVIAEILLDRYELRAGGVITHSITNVSPEALKSLYGERLYDRFKDMFDMIVMTGESYRGSSAINSIPQKPEPVEEITLTTEQIRTRMVSACFLEFDNYKRTKTVRDFGNIAYQFLVDEKKIELEAGTKKAFMEEGRERLKLWNELHPPQDDDLKVKLRNKLQELRGEKNASVICEAKRIALEWYFQNLIDEKKELEIT